MDLETLAGQLYSAIVGGEWWMAASLAVVLVVWALRTYGGGLPVVGPKLAPWLAHPVVSWALPLVGASAAAVAASLAAGQPLGAALLAAVKVAAGAVFAYVGARKVVEAQKLGQAAAGEVKTPEDALRLMGGPGQ